MITRATVKSLLPFALLLMAAVLLRVVLPTQAAEALASTSTSHCGPITSSASWTPAGNPHIVTCDVSVNTGVTLTVQAGTLVKFSGVSSDLIVDGRLLAQGTSLSPVVFTSYKDDDHGGDDNGDGTSTSPAPSDWGGIFINGSSSGSVLEYAWIGYGGYGGSLAHKAIVHLFTSNVTVENNIIARSGKMGLHVAQVHPLQPLVLRANSFLTNTTWAAYAELAGDATNLILAGNSSVGSTYNGFGLQGTISGTATLSTTAAFPFVIDWDVTVGEDSTLTLTPGTAFKFRPGTQDLIVDGRLLAQGSEQEPIIFTSLRDDEHGGDTNGDSSATTPGPADWGGIFILATSGGSVLEHTWIGYGGCGGSLDHKASVNLRTSDVTVENNVIVRSGKVGLHVAQVDPLHALELRSNEFLTNTSGAVYADLTGEFTDVTLVANTSSGSPQNGLGLKGALSGTATFSGTADFPFIVDQDVTVQAGSAMTVTPGTVFKFDGWSEYLIVDGRLTARGEPSRPIMFTSIRDDHHGGDANGDGGSTGPAPADWGGIVLTSSSSDSILEHTWIGYGGYGGTYPYANLHLFTGDATIRDNVISHSGNQGLHVAEFDSRQPLTLTANTFLSNTWWAAYSDPTDHMADVTLVGNTSVGSAHNGFGIRGSVSGTAVYSSSAVFPFIIHEDMAIQAGSALTLTPGTVVKVDQGWFGNGLIVDGNLVARGTVTKPVVFTDLGDDSIGGDTNGDGPSTGASGGWGYIAVRGAEASALDHVEVRYGGKYPWGAVLIDGGTLRLRNSVVRDASQHGVQALNSGRADLVNNLIVHNSGTGIEVASSSWITAINNTVDDNIRGVQADDALATLVNNLISASSQYGVRVANGGTVVPRYNDVFNSGISDWHGLADPTGTDGNLSSDPLYVDPDSNLYDLQSRSAAIDAATSDGAPATDLLGRSRFDDPGVANIGGGSLPYYDMGALERQDVSDPVNLVIENPTLSITETQIGDPLVISWTVRNDEVLKAGVDWSDSVFASSDPTWDLNDALVAQVERTGGLEPGGSYDVRVDFLTPASIAGDLFFLIRADARQQLRESIESDNQVVLTATLGMPELVLNVPYHNQFSAAGESHYYQLVVPPFRSLRLELDSAATAGSNELYVRDGAIPSAGRFDARSALTYEPDQELLLGRTEAITYYVMAHTQFGAASWSPYTLTASLPGFDLFAVSPEVGGNTGNVTVRLDGADFTRFTSVTLSHESGTVLTATETFFHDNSTLFATFELSGTPTGPYDLRVLSRQNVAEQTEEHPEVFEMPLVQGDRTLPDAFEVVAGSRPEAEIHLLLPSAVRLGLGFLFHLEIANEGNADVLSPVVHVSSPNGTPLSPWPDVSAGSATELQILALSERGRRTILAPGERFLVPLYGFATQEPNTHIAVQDLAETAVTPLDWDALESYYRDSYTDEDWAQTWANFRGIVGDTWADFHGVMRLAAEELPPAGGARYLSGTELILDLLNRARHGQSDASGFEPPFTGMVSPLPVPISDTLKLSVLPGSAATLVTGDACTASPDECDDYRPPFPGSLTAAETWVNTLLFPYLNRKFGPEVEALWRKFVSKTPNSLETFTSPTDPIIAGNSKARGFRNDPVTTQTLAHVLNGVSLEVKRRIQRGTLKVGDLPKNEDVDHDSFENLLGADTLDSSSKLAGDKNYAKGLDYVRDYTIPGSIAGGIGSSEHYGADRRRITGRVTLHRLVNGDEETVQVTLRSDASVTVEDTIDFCPGDLGGWIEQLATRPLKRLEANYWAHDVPFIAEFQAEPNYFAIPCHLLRQLAGHTLGGGFDCDLPSCQPPAVDPDGDGEDVPTIRPSDPNDIVGPAGFGAAHWLPPKQQFAYTVHFENDPEEATAPAQIVTVTNQLDSGMDWSAFELGAMGFGQYAVPVPPGQQSYKTSVDWTNEDGSPLLVEIEAGLDPATGLVTWGFRSLDPATGLPPTDPFAGFLPVNDDSHRGEGFLIYVVQPVDGIVSGTVISNQASIVFDFNDPIVTNMVTNTIDSLPPTSGVLTLPITSTQAFSVTWAGEDEGGSGIAFYDVYSSANSGPFAAWQTGITGTQAVFTGSVGSSYGFYSMATDNVGHQQETPAEAQARTTVVAIPGVPALLSPLDGTITRTQALTLTWQSGSGVAPDGYNLGLDGTVVTTTMTTSPAVLSNSVHTWTVRAYNVSGYSPWVSPAWSLEIDTLAPSSSVEPLPATSRQVFTVTWSGGDSGGSGIAFYDVYSSTRGGPLAIWQAAITGTQALVTGAAGSTYGFYSIATDRAGNQEAEPLAAQASTTVVAAPGIPALLSPANGTVTGTLGVTLTWQPGPGATADGYNVDLDGTVLTTTMAHSPTILAPGLHAWTVRAYNVSGYSGWASPSWTLEIDSVAPDSSVDPLPVTSSATFTVTWSGDDPGGSGLAFYDLYVSIDGGLFTRWQTATVATEAVFTGTSGSMYGFYSVAADAAGNRQDTPLGAQATTTVVAAPGTPVLLAPAHGTVTSTQELTLTWQAGAGGPPDGYNMDLDGGVVTTTATIWSTSLLVGTRTWTVRAFNVAGVSAWAEPAWYILVESPKEFIYLPIVVRRVR